MTEQFDDHDMRETVARVELDDFYEQRGKPSMIVKIDEGLWKEFLRTVEGEGSWSEDLVPQQHKDRTEKALVEELVKLARLELRKSF